MTTGARQAFSPGGHARTAEGAPIGIDMPERFSYRCKRVLLGRPLVNEQLYGEKLSKKAALGVLSSDNISSAAYGSEEMLIVLLGVFGLTGFRILLPMTAAVIAVLVIMALMYREVVMVYTRAGGSYVVARENFGPKVAQLAAVALLIDYVVTVAVQAAAGTAAITSLVPALRSVEWTYGLTIGVVLLLAYGNLRGVREAGNAFAFPTYFFVAAAGAVVLVGILREIFGDLPRIAYSANEQASLYQIVNEHHPIISGFAIFILLKAFANGGSSLTGLEAISNSTSALKPPEGRNARTVLTVMATLLGVLVTGISYLAFETHATPFESGSPTVISQVAKAAFGTAWYGHIGFVLVQLATALILFTGANTPFTGFPFLASFIAEDSFLPRQLTRRGHRLAFSNGILVLTVGALALLLGTSGKHGPNVDRLIPFYAIGVFTGFAMAGFGMLKHYVTRKEPGWRHRAVISVLGGVISTLVVLIFAVVKFTEGAWLVVVLFPILWFALMRLNRRYRAESRSLDLASAARQDQAEAPLYPRHTVLVLVDRLDLAVLRALRYAGTLRPNSVRAVHIRVDTVMAEKLEYDWLEHRIGDRVPLEIRECSDRRLVRAISQLSLDTVILDRAEVTVLLPRRTFHAFSQHVLHDRTADRIAEAVSRIPHVAATIVPFDTTMNPEMIARIEASQVEASKEPALISGAAIAAPRGRLAPPAPAIAGIASIGSVAWRQKVTVEGRVKAVQVGTQAGKSLEVQLFDSSGGMRLLFFGRTRIAGIRPGTYMRASGRVGEYKGHLAIANPVYELISTD
ncbi:MAG TPA: amino acid permease [Jatrophihabitans sp.]